MMKLDEKASDLRWWPPDLGDACTGETDALRYAFSPIQHRLMVDDAGDRAMYATGEHDIVRIAKCPDGEAIFTSQNGKFALKCLVRVP